ncbi:MAG: type II toxin-antitoxin system RelE/ParE family toxin [Pacificimonas sp.]
MTWTVEFLPEAKRDLDALDKAVGIRIAKALADKISVADDPRDFAKRLRGTKRDYWRWRVGDYRLIGSVDGDRIRVLIVAVGHRRSIYS